MSIGSDPEARILALEQRLRALEDLEAIRNLKARYGELVDARYAGGAPKSGPELEALAQQIAELFTEDAVWDGGKALGVCRGRQDIFQRFARPTLNFSWHYFVKPNLRVEGDRAQGRWDILAPGTNRNDEPFWMAGVEDDEYVRQDGRWLHERMALTVVFMAPYERGWARREP